MLEYVGHGSDGQPRYRRLKVRAFHDEERNETYLVDERGRDVEPDDPPQPEEQR